jgi:hypothetical protein
MIRKDFSALTHINEPKQLISRLAAAMRHQPIQVCRDHQAEHDLRYRVDIPGEHSNQRFCIAY